MNEKLSELCQTILTGDVREAQERVQAALDTEIEPEEILNKGMIAAMQEVGQLYEQGKSCPWICNQQMVNFWNQQLQGVRDCW